MEEPKTQPAARPKPKPVPVKLPDIFPEVTLNVTNFEKFPFSITWKGPLDANKLPRGLGTFACSDGRTYTGNWETKVYQGHIYLENNHKHNGKIVYPDGSQFEGIFTSGMDPERLFWRGIGTYTTSDGTVTKGHWNDQEILKYKSSNSCNY